MASPISGSVTGGYGAPFGGSRDGWDDSRSGSGRNEGRLGTVRRERFLSDDAGRMRIEVCAAVDDGGDAEAVEECLGGKAVDASGAQSIKHLHQRDLDGVRVLEGR